MPKRSRVCFVLGGLLVRETFLVSLSYILSFVSTKRWYGRALGDVRSIELLLSMSTKTHHVGCCSSYHLRVTKSRTALLEAQSRPSSSFETKFGLVLFSKKGSSRSR